jgi:hypothetical protein
MLASKYLTRLILGLLVGSLLAGCEQEPPCGYTTRSGLLADGQRSLQEFSGTRLPSLSPQEISALPALIKSTETHSPATDLIYDNFRSLMNEPALEEVAAQGQMQVFFTDRPLYVYPYSLANSAAIVLPTDWLSKAQRRLSTADFNLVSTGIMAHELGHFVYDNLPKQHTPLTPLHYHLLVDAIGMSLAHLSVNEFIRVLELAVEPGSYQGDIPTRLNCLRNLSK